MPRLQQRGNLAEHGIDIARLCTCAITFVACSAARLFQALSIISIHALCKSPRRRRQPMTEKLLSGLISRNRE
jgi:hypothetical protein